MHRSLLAIVPVALIAAVALQALPAAAQSPSPTVGTGTPSPSGTPTAPPPPAGTPWPAPANLRVSTEARLLDEDGRPLPPPRQEHTDVLTWDHLPAFDGEYEVEVSLVPIGGGEATVLQPYMRFPADRGAGEIRRVSPYPEWLNNQRCYRIRTTILSGAGTIETGPFSAQACTVKPPSSGAPGPPPTGTGTSNRTAEYWSPELTAALAALGVGAITAMGLFAGRPLRQRSKSPGR